MDFAFKPGRPVFSSVDLEVAPGEFVLVMGPSSSGKTTLLRLIQMELSPQSGNITVANYSSGRITRRHMPAFRRTLGVIHQDFRLVSTMTVYENVSLSLKVRGSSARRVKESVFRALAEIGLSAAAHLYPEELSGGEKQKTAIARALIGKPVLLLADEPTALLDARAGEEIIELLKTINIGGTTVVMASHSEITSWELPCRVIEINQCQLKTVRSNAKAS